MISLALAVLFFLGIHLLVAGTKLRDRLIAKLGLGRYLGLFSLASAAGLVWICIAYRTAPMVETWGKQVALKPLALVGVLIAIPFVVVGVTTPSPTGVGGEGQLARGSGAVGLQRITRHPFLWGVALWAAMHLIVNGDLAALLLFGSMLLLALCGTVSIDRKRQRTLGPQWAGFAATTSNLPFLAVIQGRSRLRPGEIKWWQWGAALAVAGGILAGHEPLFGVSPLPS